MLSHMLRLNRLTEDELNKDYSIVKGSARKVDMRGATKFYSWQRVALHGFAYHEHTTYVITACTCQFEVNEASSVR